MDLFLRTYQDLTAYFPAMIIILTEEVINGRQKSRPGNAGDRKLLRLNARTARRLSTPAFPEKNDAGRLCHQIDLTMMSKEEIKEMAVPIEKI